MSLTLCKVSACKYNKQGICQNGLIEINNAGVCSELAFENGGVKPGWNESLSGEYKDQVRIVDFYPGVG